MNVSVSTRLVTTRVDVPDDRASADRLLADIRRDKRRHVNDWDPRECSSHYNPATGKHYMEKVDRVPITHLNAVVAVSGPGFEGMEVLGG